MKYKIHFSFTVVKASRTIGICFQGHRGDVEIVADQPVTLEDQDTVDHVTNLILADLAKQGYNVVVNMFKIEAIAPV